MLLQIHAPAVIPERAGRLHHTMARHDQGNRIFSHSASHRAGCAGFSYIVRNIAIGPHAPFADLKQRPPYVLLEIRAAQIKRNIVFPALLPCLDDGNAQRLHGAVIPNKIGLGKMRFHALQPVALIAFHHKAEPAQSFRGFSQHDLAQRRLIKSVCDFFHDLPPASCYVFTMPMSTENIHEFFSRLRARDPEPKSELAYTNTYTLLVAVVLSAQATDAGVNKATKALFKTADTPQKMLDLGLDRLKEHIKTIGLFNTKAKNVIALSDILVRDYGGAVPDTREALVTLPGVGRKTANVVLNVAFHQPTMAVDTHIFRVSNRTGLAPGKTPEKVEEVLMRVVPDEFALHAHHWLILLGRYRCKARKPECGDCPVHDLCAFADKTA